MNNSEPSSTPSAQAGPRGSRRSGILGPIVRIERAIQVGLTLPVATFLGWAIGVGLDHWLKQHWIYIPGLLLGTAAGFLQIFRTVAALSREKE